VAKDADFGLIGGSGLWMPASKRCQFLPHKNNLAACGGTFLDRVNKIFFNFNILFASNLKRFVGA
jgi:hypothetical protein